MRRPLGPRQSPYWALLTGSLILIWAGAAGAAPKTFSELLKLSQQNRTEVSGEKSQERKLHKLIALEKEIESVLKEYRKLNPTEGDQAEEAVSMFFYSLEPVLKLKKGAQKPSAADCEKARHQIEFEDKGSAKEDTPLSPEAQEALEWVAILCSSK